MNRPNSVHDPAPGFTRARPLCHSEPARHARSRPAWQDGSRGEESLPFCSEVLCGALRFFATAQNDRQAGRTTRKARGGLLLEEFSVIGKRVPLIDAPAKATGQATYVADLTMPGMLYGAVLRSPHSHARILSLDATPAKRMPGVKSVITGRDTRD